MMILTEKDYDKDGCSYGQVSRERVDNYEKSFNKFVNNDFKHLKIDVKSLVKNQNKRPTWFGAALVVILTNLVIILAAAQIMGK